MQVCNYIGIDVCIFWMFGCFVFLNVCVRMYQCTFCKVSVHLSTCLTIYPSPCLSAVYLSIFYLSLPACLAGCLSVCLSVYLAVLRSIQLCLALSSESICACVRVHVHDARLVLGALRSLKSVPDAVLQLSREGSLQESYRNPL